MVEQTFVDLSFSGCSLEGRSTALALALACRSAGVWTRWAHVFAEALAVLAAGEVQVSVQVEVVGRELGHTHDGLLALVSDGVRALLLDLAHQTLLQTRDHLSLRVQVLRDETGT